jgi:hypothetical protein
MTKAMEDKLWRRGKRPIVAEYLTTHKQLEDVVAGQGFLHRPGYLSAAATAIERAAKSKLSDLNHQILKESIERELAQTGHDYEISYKEARISWELEKTALLTALDQEFADNKMVRELDRQELNRMEITVNLRKLVIMAAKTAIDIDMEALRREMTRVDRSTFAAEDALHAARLLTAQKKLEVIPYIETVLEKQQAIINAETANADRKTALISEKENLNDKRVQLITAREAIADAIVELIAAKQALVTKKESLITAGGLVAAQEETNIGYLNQYILALSGLSDVQHNLVAAKKALIPKINEKSTALIAYAAELDAWIAVKNTIAGVKEDIASYMEDRAGKKGDIIGAKVDLNALKLGLQEAEINLAIAKTTGKTDLMTQRIANAADMLTERQAAFDARLSREGDLLGKQVEIDLYEALSAFETMRAVNDVEIPAAVRSLSRIVLARIQEREGTAAAAANAELTSQLVHVLS